MLRPSDSEKILEGGHNTSRLSAPSISAKLSQKILGVQSLANESDIEDEIQEYVKIRASQINGCAHCLSMHWRDSLKMGIRPDKLATLSAWREAPWYSPRERAALSWTEVLTNLPKHEVTDELFNTCLEVFSEEEMVELSTMIIAINNWNRLAIGFGTPPDPFALSEVQ